jgi:hypothetical protein
MPGRYLEDEQGNPLCGWPDVAGGVRDYKVKSGEFPRMMFGRVRRSGLPRVEKGGRIDPLGIPSDAGLVEITHVVFFPNNIVGADFNFYGPRVPRLGLYLHTLCPGQCPPLTLLPLLKGDIRGELNRVGCWSCKCFEATLIA